MGMYQHIREIWKNPKENLGDIWKQRLIEWRRDNSVVRLEHPTRLDRARSLGFKAKKGYIIVRVKLKRGGRKRERFSGGRKPRKMRRHEVIKKSYQWIAEERANKKYPNCEVLNSYFVAKDGKHYWYEIILLDKETVKNYPETSWVGNSQSRVYRGLTSAGRKSRGLRGKGFGYEKIRPSLKANKRLGK